MRWHVRTNSESSELLDEAVVAERVRAGTIQADASVRPETGADWILVKESPFAAPAAAGKAKPSPYRGPILVLVALGAIYGGLSLAFGSGQPEEQEEARAPGPMPPTAAESEALDMARALRKYYPAVRIASEMLDDAQDCEKQAKSGKERKVCSDTYNSGVQKLRAMVPNEPLTGCSQSVADSVRTVLDAAVAEAPVNLEKAGGVDFGKLHEGYERCAGTLFRVGAGEVPDSPARAFQLERHLGLRSGDKLNVAQFQEKQMGHLWTASGREIDRQSVSLMP